MTDGRRGCRGLVLDGTGRLAWRIADVTGSVGLVMRGHGG
jgi:hypothetical protein